MKVVNSYVRAMMRMPPGMPQHVYVLAANDAIFEATAERLPPGFRTYRVKTPGQIAALQLATDACLLAVYGWERGYSEQSVERFQMEAQQLVISDEMSGMQRTFALSDPA